MIGRVAALALLGLVACPGPGADRPVDTGPHTGDSAPDTGDDAPGPRPDDRLLGESHAVLVGDPASATGHAVALAPGWAALSAPFAGVVCTLPLPVPAGPLGLADAACLHEAAALDYPGWSLDLRGDADGDGLPELALGAVGADGAGPEAGAAWLVPGTALGVGGALGELARRHEGEAALDYAGSAVALLDVDGDGLSELAVGAQGHTGGGAGAGAAYLLRAPLGGGGPLGEATLRVDGEGEGGPGPPHSAPSVGDGVGAVLANGGDVDGDGLDDLLLGANGADDLAFDGGLAALFLGPVGEGRRSLRDADRLWLGARADLVVGDSVAGVGDLDGDGHGEVLVGGEMGGSGTTWLVPGPGAAGAVDVEGAARTRFVGEAPGDVAGSYTAPVGDVDGDGAADLLLGAYGVDVYGYSDGAAYLVRGPFPPGVVALGEGATRFVGPGDGAVAGSAVAGGGDVDGDGLGDLLVGARYATGGGSFAGEAYFVVP